MSWWFGVALGIMELVAAMAAALVGILVLAGVLINKGMSKPENK